MRQDKMSKRLDVWLQYR